MRAGSTWAWSLPVVVAGHLGALHLALRLDPPPPAAPARSIEVEFPPVPAPATDEASSSPVPRPIAPFPAPSTPPPEAPTGVAEPAPPPGGSPELAAEASTAPDEHPAPSTGATETVEPVSGPGDPVPGPRGPDVEGGVLEATDYLANPAPSYPLASRLLGEEGKVLLEVRVDTNGRAIAVGVHRTSGSPRLDGAALLAVWSWTFHPARRGGRPVQARVIVPVRFSLKGA